MWGGGGGGGGEEVSSCVVQGCESSDFYSDFRLFCSSQNPIFRLLMLFECIEKHIFSGISDYFQTFSHKCSHTPGCSQDLFQDQTVLWS